MPGALTLAIEVSNPSSSNGEPTRPAPDGAGVALGRVEGAGSPSPTVELLDAEPVAPATRQEDDLFPAIDRLFKRAGLTPRDLRGGRVAVSVGPGGYTGLRVACAAGKCIAEAVGAACVAVPTALVALARVPAGARPALAPGRRIGVALASKNDAAWVFVEGRQDPTASRFLTAAAAPALVKDDGLALLLADSFLPDPIRAACAAHGVAIAPLILSAAACLEVSATLPEINPALLAPIYAREPDAVTQWRSRYGGEQQGS